MRLLLSEKWFEKSVVALLRYSKEHSKEHSKEDYRGYQLCQVPWQGVLPKFCLIRLNQLPCAQYYRCIRCVHSRFKSKRKSTVSATNWITTIKERNIVWGGLNKFASCREQKCRPWNTHLDGKALNLRSQPMPKDSSYYWQKRFNVSRLEITFRYWWFTWCRLLA